MSVLLSRLACMPVSAPVQRYNTRNADEVVDVELGDGSQISADNHLQPQPGQTVPTSESGRPLPVMLPALLQLAPEKLASMRQSLFDKVTRHVLDLLSVTPFTPFRREQSFCKTQCVGHTMIAQRMHCNAAIPVVLSACLTMVCMATEYVQRRAS